MKRICIRSLAALAAALVMSVSFSAGVFADEAEDNTPAAAEENVYETDEEDIEDIDPDYYENARDDIDEELESMEEPADGPSTDKVTTDAAAVPAKGSLSTTGSAAADKSIKLAKPAEKSTITAAESTVNPKTGLCDISLALAGVGAAVFVFGKRK